MKTSQEAAQGSAEIKNKIYFSDQFSEQLSRVCDTFGVTDRSLAGLVEATQPWARGDHYDPSLSLELTPNQIDAVLGLARSANMLDEVPLPQGGIDRILVLGGEQESNQQRLDWLIDQMRKRKDINYKNIFMLGGNRTLKGRELQPLASGFVRSSKEDPWIDKSLKAELTDMFTEDSGLRVALSAALGSAAALEQLHLRFGTANDREIVSHRIFSTNVGRVSIINAKAIDRPLGQPRHTTESSLEEWLDIDQGLEGEETVALISSNPYIPRTHRNITRIVRNKYPNMEVFTCGPGAVHDDLLNRRIMGEIARHIFEDSRANF